jgi:hypothetical protein
MFIVLGWAAFSTFVSLNSFSIALQEHHANYNSAQRTQHSTHIIASTGHTGQRRLRNRAALTAQPESTAQRTQPKGLELAQKSAK